MGIEVASQYPIAVVDEQPSRVAVWHVDVSGDIPAGMSRLTGSWVVDASDTETLTTLLTDRYVARCDPASAHSVVEQFSISGRIDLDATVDAVRTEILELDKLFTEHVASVKGKLVRPVWPDVPDPRAVVLRPVSAPDEPRRKGADALDLARGIRDLADAWAQIEALRAARPFLAEPAGKAMRPLPLEVS
ncbi:hypothetical protein EV641_111210 [Rhodococcus sp. SMB37]|uniref:hypothetical protein n=1 Tax=Rhodococcus sp. SMB37 TaxID=2512213 RepID=UPI0010527AFF|nr:hypothetical protein [Rhodococcus sp. SMB37]TCN50934.1 hypothetical protein EV641_111210 [Rhodococcus sp. SMB37]